MVDASGSRISACLLALTRRVPRAGPVRRIISVCFAVSSLTLAAVGHAASPVYDFKGIPDGGEPDGGMLNWGGALVGTTLVGGAGAGCQYGCGTVYSVTQQGQETILYRFQPGNSDGEYPTGELINLNGSLYGTTSGGGANGMGSVYKLTPPGKSGDPWIEEILYSFRGGSDGANPNEGLYYFRGSLFGTTYSGGAASACTLSYGCGVVYKLTPSKSGSSAWHESVVHTFSGKTAGDGARPISQLIEVSGSLYGTTYMGGGSTCANGCGTVFAITPPITQGQPWTETTIYAFASNNSSDGYWPVGGLVAIQGYLYGIATSGGSYVNCNTGCGAVFQLAPPGVAGGPWGETLAYEFLGGTDGLLPQAGLIRVGASLFGTTSEGGGSGQGTVFKLSPPKVVGGAWTEKVIHTLSGAEGSLPDAPLVEVGGLLYGAAAIGGTPSGACPQGCGAVFVATP